MKKMLLMGGLVAMMALTTSCGTTRATQRLAQVEVGMTKAQVLKLLGDPLFRQGDLDGQQWGYRKVIGQKVVDMEEVLFLVDFDSEGNVVGYRTVKEMSHRH